MMKEREMKDSGIPWIGMIPKGWEIQPFKFNATIHNGSDYKHIVSEKGYPVLGSGGIFAYAKEYLHDGDAVLLGRKGTIDKPLFINGKFWTVDTMFYAITYKHYFSKFLYYQAINFPFQYYSSSTALPSMKASDFLSHKLVVPPLSEQKAIAEFLDRKCGDIDELISLQERMIDELKAYKQSVITEVVTKGLNPNAPLKDSGIEWIGQIPEHWGVVPLKTILCQPLQYGANESGVSYDKELPRYVRITDISNNTLREDIKKLSLTEEQAKGYFLDDGDILFARSGATVGKSFIFSSRFGLCAFAGYLIRAKINNQNSPKFIYYYTQSNTYNEWKQQIFIQATIQNIGADRYSLLPVILPPLSEQQAIADYLDKKSSEIDSLVALKQAKIEELKDYKKSIIYEYVTGKKEVQINDI